MTSEQVIEVGKALLPYLRDNISDTELEYIVNSVATALRRTEPFNSDYDQEPHVSRHDVSIAMFKLTDQYTSYELRNEPEDYINCLLDKLFDNLKS